ncbi:MAG: DUF551 domain-containing protein [Acidaminococcaceae bacterium]|nr:DUF551 domain-containing protein [Acidaminococcaceae bacterium]
MAELEKVIEHLKEIAEYFRGCRSNASFASKAENHFWELQNAASEAAELLKAQEPGWISVKDRLPDSNRFVLVCNDDGHMMIAQYIEETAQWQYKYINYDVDVWDDEEQGPVCYWAYLPEPPKES